MGDPDSKTHISVTFITSRHVYMQRTPHTDQICLHTDRPNIATPCTCSRIAFFSFCAAPRIFMVPQSSTAGQGMPDQGRKREHLGPGVPAKRCAPIRPSVLGVLDESHGKIGWWLQSSVGDEFDPAKLTDGRHWIQMNDSDSNFMNFSPTPNSACSLILVLASSRRHWFSQTNEVRYG